MLFTTECNILTDQGRAFSAFPCPRSILEAALAWFCLWITHFIPPGFIVNKLGSLVWPRIAAPCPGWAPCPYKEAQHGPHSPAWPWHSSTPTGSPVWTSRYHLQAHDSSSADLPSPSLPESPAQARCWVSAHLAPLSSGLGQPLCPWNLPQSHPGPLGPLGDTYWRKKIIFFSTVPFRNLHFKIWEK